MPFVKPGTLMVLQKAAKSGMKQSTLGDDADHDKLRGALSVCIVCGNANCDKTPVRVNGVYVHREDAINAESVWDE